MTLDAFDLAFVSRWEARATPPVATPPVATPPGHIHEFIGVDAALVDRVLAAARPQWETLADEVEAARLCGHRVIAVTGREPREGRSTLVACLGLILRERDRDVVFRTPGGDGSLHDGLTAGRHDRRIVLVDAGVWFPPGPIHRQRLMLASVGCDAVIVVRRACRPPAPAQAAALAAIGVTPLGEVLTFAGAGDHGTVRPEPLA